MKKILLVMVCVLLTISLVACGGKTESITDMAVDTAGNIIEETTTEVVSEDIENFEELAGAFELPFGEELYFYTEAEDGSWNNAMTFKPDGSIYGSFYELDKTLIGDNYQNGTYYWNTYWGNFDEILWLDEYTYSITLKDLGIENEEGQERLEDDSFKSVTTIDMKGITNEGEYVLFVPSTPLRMLPEDIIELLNLDLSNQEFLDMFVLLDTTQQIAFWAEEPQN